MAENETPPEDRKSSQQWVGVGIALGLVFGALAGLLFFENLALGAGIGLSFGIALGAAMDSGKKQDD